MNKYLAPGQYLPHNAPLVLIDSINEITEASVSCQTIVDDKHVIAPFLNANNNLDSWFGIELMAQSVGIWNGWNSLLEGRIASMGFLLGARNFQTARSYFSYASILTINAKLFFREQSLANFDCEILLECERLATAKINVFEPNEQEINHLLNLEKLECT